MKTTTQLTSLALLTALSCSLATASYTSLDGTTTVTYDGTGNLVTQGYTWPSPRGDIASLGVNNWGGGDGTSTNLPQDIRTSADGVTPITYSTNIGLVPSSYTGTAAGLGSLWYGTKIRIEGGQFSQGGFTMRGGVQSISTLVPSGSVLEIDDASNTDFGYKNLDITNQMTMWDSYPAAGNTNDLALLNGYVKVGQLAGTSTSKNNIHILHGKLDVGSITNANFTLNLLAGGTGQFNLAQADDNTSGTAGDDELRRAVLNFESGSRASFTIATLISTNGADARNYWADNFTVGDVQIDGVNVTDLSGFTIESVGDTGTKISLTPPDLDPPTPNPATFSSAPAPSSAARSSTISMTATTGTDSHTVWYYFAETSGNPGADDSGWQTSPSYTDSGLDGDTQYTYTVQMRDSVTTPNVGAASSPASARTDVHIPVDYFIAPDGSDATGDGSIANPYETITKAQSVASSSDTVYLRGGTYSLETSDITYTFSGWDSVNHITQNGISYIAYQGESPIFDFSAVKPVGRRVTAFLIEADNCVFEGFEVVGVQATIADAHAQFECFRIVGGGKLQIEADFIAGGGLTVDSGAAWVLHADGDSLQFHTVSIAGTSLAAGVYSFADLVADFPEVTGASSGTLTVEDSSQVLYQDDFLGDTYSLNGVRPETTIDSAAWSADGLFTSDGTVAPQQGAAILPFEPRAGTIYRLQTRFTNGSAGWLAVGFKSSDQISGSAACHTADGWGWVLSQVSAENNQQAFLGFAAANPVISGNIVDSTSAIDVQIELDTTGGESGAGAWTVTYKLNGIDQGTYDLDNAVKTGIHYVGFSRNGGSVSATIEQFILSDTMPVSSDSEPAIVDIAIVAGNLVELTIQTLEPSTTYALHSTNLVDGLWERVPHSDNGINAFVETNLSYSSMSAESNVVIYAKADHATEFFQVYDVPSPTVYIGTAWLRDLEDLADRTQWSRVADRAGLWIHPHNFERTYQLAATKVVAGHLVQKYGALERNALPTFEYILNYSDWASEQLGLNNGLIFYFNGGRYFDAPGWILASQYAQSLGLKTYMGLAPHVIDDKGWSDSIWDDARAGLADFDGYAYDAPQRLYIPSETYRKAVWEPTSYCQIANKRTVYLLSCNLQGGALTPQDWFEMGKETVIDMHLRGLDPEIWAIENYSNDLDYPVPVVPETNWDGSHAYTVTGLALWIMEYYDALNLQ